MMYYEEEMNCPLCMERMDWTDQQLKPCDCGYQVCVWCWHQIMDMAAKNETDGRCPACHAPYDKDKIIGLEANFERVAANNGSRKNKQQKARPKTIEGKKDLSNVRVIQRRMAYVIGLPLSLADEDLLQRKEYFGQYGKVCKVSLSRTAGGTLQQFVNDSCSAYITFSTEDEAVRCIQSVHGFVLEGRFLKASFGTAKYCHAWLRNTPCNNSACLYLHNLGAEEDSFSKDEVAAAHTRGRVQQIVGATHNLHRGSGNMLPPPIDEPNNYISATDNSRSDLKDVVPDMEISNFPSLSKDNDGGVREPNNLTTFVDIIGRPDNSDREKDVYEAEDRMAVNLSFELPLLGINKDNYVEAALSDEMLGSFSSSSPLCNQLLSNKELSEPFRQPSNLRGLGRGDLTSTDAFTNKQPDLIFDSEKQGSRGALKEGSVSLNDVKLKGSSHLCQIAPLHPSSYPTKTTEDSKILLLSHGESHNPNGYNSDESFIPCLNSVNDGSNEKKFQCSAKSDKIYRCSNSFSNEEIVEHLRRLDDGDKTHDAQNSLEAIESSIISDIMSLHFDDDSLTSHCSVTGLFDQTEGLRGSTWNPYNNDKSEFSFVKKAGSVNQLTDLDTLGNTGHHFQKCSLIQDLRESKEQCPCKPQYLVSRTQGTAPPGFSLPLRELPPGFSASDRLDHSFHANSGTHMVKATSFPKNHYRTPSTGNSSNTSDADILDPTIMSLVRGKAPNGLTNSCYDTRSTYTSQPSELDDEARLWLLMQQSAGANQDFNYGQNYIQQQGLAAHEDLRYAQTYMEQQTPTAFPDLKYAETYIQQQAPNAHQDLKYTQNYRQQEAPATYQDLKYAQTYMQQQAPTSHRNWKYSQTGMQQASTARQEAQQGQIGDRYSSVDDLYGVSAKYTSLQKQSNNLSSVSLLLSQQRFTNGAIPNGHQPGLNEIQIRNELQGNERLGFDKFYSGYGEYIRQPSSGDLYTRVFGM